MHTEFVTYTIFAEGVAERPFSGEVFTLFPADWLAAAPGLVVTSCLVRVEVATEALDARLEADVIQWFVPESLAVSRVVDGDAVIAADFRIDENGHCRMAALRRARRSASAGWGASCSGCSRSRPTRAWRC